MFGSFISTLLVFSSVKTAEAAQMAPALQQRAYKV
jgi:hypothetical protein